MITRDSLPVAASPSSLALQPQPGAQFGAAMTSCTYIGSVTGTLGARRDEGESAASENRETRDRLGAAFESHRAELLGFARQSLGDPELAEEAVQETFVRALRTQHGFNPELGPIRPWLFAIERHIIVDLARSQSARQAQELDRDLPSEVDQLDAAMRAWNVEEALRHLGPEHRQVVLEIYYRGRPSRELARQLGIPEGTVRSRLYYALRALRLTLDEMGWNE
ncbi:MAG: sigma-70 family RNA polymerase sigma factor [Candidatus Dormiibacterota bacterium]